MASDPGQPGPIRGPQVVQWLLANNYLLTAFELLVEAQEGGKEADLGFLKEFFSDRNKFPPDEISQFDQDDAVNLQKLAKQREEKLSIVEYDLRIAREDLAELQKAQSSGRELQGKGVWTSDPQDAGSVSALEAAGPSENSDGLCQHLQGPATAWERQQLNAVVKEFLGQAGYRLTAITFQEEAGEAGPLPQGTTPSLLHLLRAHVALGPSLASQQELEGKCTTLGRELEEARTAAATAQEGLAAAVKEGNRLRADLEYAHSRLDWSNRQLQEVEAASLASAKEAKPRSAGRRDGDEAGLGLVNIESVLREVSRTLPKIVPNVLINKREELVPLFLALIQEDRNAEQREKLTHALFNIVKKPSAAQRRMICSAFCDLARRIGLARTSEELLPQCWEQVGHRHAERRVLVAEAVGDLAPLVAPEMRGSLLLSILQQLACDEDAAVRLAATCRLAALLPHLPDSDKFPLVKGLLLGLLEDRAHDVVEAVFDKLVPASLAWTLLTSPALLQDLLARILATLLQCPKQGAASMALGNEMRLIGDAHLRQVQVMLRLFIQLLPDFQVCLIRQAPAWARGAPSRTPSSSPTHAEAEPAAPARASTDAAPQMNGSQDTSHSTKRDTTGASSPSASPVPNGSALPVNNRVGKGEEAADEATSADGGRPNSANRVSPETNAGGGRSSTDQGPALSGGTGPSGGDSPAGGSDALYCGTDGSRAAPGGGGTDRDGADGGGKEITAMRSGTGDTSDVGVGSAAAPSSCGTEQERGRQEGSDQTSGSGAEAGTGSPGDRARDRDPASDAAERGRGVADGLSPAAGGEREGLVSGESQRVGVSKEGESAAADDGRAGDQPGCNVDDGGEVEMARWLEAEQHAEWELMEWCLGDCVPGLLQACRMVPPACEVESLRRRLCMALKGVCEVVGAEVSQRYVELLFCVAATVAVRRPAPLPGSRDLAPGAHVTKLMAEQVPQSSEAGRAGRHCLLPHLLAGVVLGEGPHCLVDMLQHLCSPLPPRNISWALQYPEEVVAAIRFAGTFEEAQSPLQTIIVDFSRKEIVSSRQCAALCAGAIAACLPSSQVMRQMVATLDLLCRDREPEVQALAIDALGEVYALQGANPTACTRLQSLFDSIAASGPEEEVQVIWAVAQRAGSLLDGQLEYVLQKALMVLAVLGQPSTGGRSPLQLRLAATAILRAVHCIYQHQDVQVMAESVRLHLVAALQALQREASLLQATDLEILNAMLEGVRNAVGGPALQHRGSGSLTPEPWHTAALSDVSSSHLASGDVAGVSGLKPSIFLRDQGRLLGLLHAET